MRNTCMTALAAGLVAAGARGAYQYDPADFAVEVVGSSGMTAPAVYNDPAAVLGRPSRYFNHSANPNIIDSRRVKVVEPAFNRGPGGESLVATLMEDSSITVRMGRKVYNDPANPFGIDLIVFGNSAFTGSSGQYGDDTTNMNTFMLTAPAAGMFERVKVSVSPDNVNWYRFDTGPYADDLFPTNAFRWDRAAAAWTGEELDPTKPVNPAYSLSSFAGLSAADVLDRYDGSAGGTGFDLGQTPFSWIEYVKFEGLINYSEGEIDAVAAVRPVPEPAVVLPALAAGLMMRRGRRK